jgi:hypothetical protein
MHLIYVAANTATLSIVAKNLVTDQATYINTAPENYVTVYSEGNLNQLSAAITGTSSTSGASLVYSFTITASGYYWIVVDVTLGDPSMTATTTPADLPTTVTDTYANGWTYTL